MNWKLIIALTQWTIWILWIPFLFLVIRWSL